MCDSTDIKFIASAQIASLVALPAWYPWYRMTTLAKQEILLSTKPNNMSHLKNYLTPNLKNITTYYRGIIPTLFMQPLYPTVLYTKELLNRKLFNSKPTIYQDCALASTIGVTTAFFATPLNCILTQVFRNKNTNGFDTTKELYQKHGIRRFFSGLSAFALRNSLFCTGLTVVYPNLQNMISVNCPALVPLKGDVLSAGLLSAMVCAGTVDFFDIVGVMRQAHVYKDMNAITMLRSVYVKHGTRGLFVGYCPKIIQVTTEIVVFNEMFKYLLKN